jgi:hypothetical protein
MKNGVFTEARVTALNKDKIRVFLQHLVEEKET